MKYLGDTLFFVFVIKDRDMRPDQSYTKALLHVASCILVIAMLQACAVIRPRESGTQYAEDASITSKVKAALFKEPSLKSSDISVQTCEGVVQLSGLAASEENIKAASDISASIQGVVSVKNDLHVK